MPRIVSVTVDYSFSNENMFKDRLLEIEKEDWKVSIAHNQIKDDFKPINKTPEKEILKKKCSECGEIKPIMEFNLTITGKRHQNRCNDCEILALQPKKIPRIVGHGKPLFIEGKAHQTDDLNNHFYENFNKLNFNPKIVWF